MLLARLSEAGSTKARAACYLIPISNDSLESKERKDLRPRRDNPSVQRRTRLQKQQRTTQIKTASFLFTQTIDAPRPPSRMYDLLHHKHFEQRAKLNTITKLTEQLRVFV
jgi:hypothetical protein